MITVKFFSLNYKFLIRSNSNENIAKNLIFLDMETGFSIIIIALFMAKMTNKIYEIVRH